MCAPGGVLSLASFGRRAPFRLAPVRLITALGLAALLYVKQPVSWGRGTAEAAYAPLGMLSVSFDTPDLWNSVRSEHEAGWPRAGFAAVALLAGVGGRSQRPAVGCAHVWKVEPQATLDLPRR